MIIKKTEDYYKWKLFKSELRTYYVKVEINKYYSFERAKLTVFLYESNKETFLTKDIFYISNDYGNSDLNVYAKRVIEDFENWKEFSEV